MGRFTGLLAALLCFTGATSNSLAYDVDTHFYATYLMARYAGIGHEVASELAIGNAWVDVSQLTTPMRFSRPRRLFHFPGNRQTLPGASYGLFKFRVFTEAEENHSMGSELLWEGMRKGNLLLVSAGLHVLMDSYGHAGYSGEMGHSEFGHWPDRPWADTGKYRGMVDKLFKALVTIRRLLPAEALDSRFVDGAGVPHVELSAAELRDKYLSNARVAAVVENDVLRDQRYLAESIRFVLDRVKHLDLVEPGVRLERLIPEAVLDGTHDTREVLTEMISELMDRQLKHGEPIFKPGTLAAIAPELPFHRLEVDEIGRDMVIERIVSELTFGHIPEPFNRTHHVEFESPSRLREREMAIRVGDLNELIFGFFGKMVKFTPDTLLDKLKAAIARFKARLTGKTAEIEKMRAAEQGREKITMSKRNRVVWIGKVLQFTYLDLILFRTPRTVANRDNLLYQYEKLHEELIANGQIKPLLTSQQYQKLEKRYAKAAQQTLLDCQRIF